MSNVCSGAVGLTKLVILAINPTRQFNQLGGKKALGSKLKQDLILLIQAN